MEEEAINCLSAAAGWLPGGGIPGTRVINYYLTLWSGQIEKWLLSKAYRRTRKKGSLDDSGQGLSACLTVCRMMAYGCS